MDEQGARMSVCLAKSCVREAGVMLGVLSLLN